MFGRLLALAPDLEAFLEELLAAVLIALIFRVIMSSSIFLSIVLVFLRRSFPIIVFLSLLFLSYSDLCERLDRQHGQELTGEVEPEYAY